MVERLLQLREDALRQEVCPARSPYGRQHTGQLFVSM